MRTENALIQHYYPALWIAEYVPYPNAPLFIHLDSDNSEYYIFI